MDSPDLNFAGLEDPEQSPTTSVSVSNSANEALQALEEKRTQLERELQAERGTREAEVAALQIKNSELERQLAEHLEHKATLVMQHKVEQDELKQDHRLKADDLQMEIDRLAERAAHLAGQNTMQQSETSRLRQQLQDAKEDTEDLRRRLEEEESRSNTLEKRKSDLLHALNEKDRILRDHRTESELDRATLEKELAELKEKLDSLERESAAQAASLTHDLERLQAKTSTQESDNAELQTMCDERGRSISEMRADAQATNVKVVTLLHLCQAFHIQCEEFLTQFVRQDIPKVKGRSSDASTSIMNSKGAVTGSRLGQSVSTKMASLDQAIEYMESRQPSEIWESVRAHCEYCISETFTWQKQCKRYKQRADKAVSTAKEKLAFTSFHVDDLALFLPTKNISERTFAAFNFGKPNHFLKPTGRLIEDMERKDWIVGKITSITEAVVDVNVDTSDAIGGGGEIGRNPYLLRPGSKYSMLEAEYWPTGSSRISTNTNRRMNSVDQAGTQQATSPNNKDAGTSPDGAFLANPADVSSSSLPEDVHLANEDSTKQEPEEAIIVETPGVTEITQDEATHADRLPSTMGFSALTAVKATQEMATQSPTTATNNGAGRSGTSSLSSSRPKDLPIMSEDSPAVPSLPESLPARSLAIPNAADEEPAFLPRVSPEVSSNFATSPQVIPRSSSSLTASKHQSMAFSRSFGSSNGSGGSSGLRNRLSSSSFLTPSKASATVASSPGVSSYMTSRTSNTSPPQAQFSSSAEADSDSRARRYTQTIGRYSSRGSGKASRSGDGHARQVSASGATAPQSSARELLRSFTAASLSGT